MLTVLFYILVIGITSVNAEETGYMYKVWNFSTMTDISECKDLTISQPSGIPKVALDEQSKSYEDMKFSKRLKTNGKVNMKDNVPTGRALKFGTQKPVILTLYTINGSSNSENKGCIANMNGIVHEIDLQDIGQMITGKDTIMHSPISLVKHRKNYYCN